MYFRDNYKPPPPGTPLNPGKRRWAGKGTLTRGHKSIQDATCHFCKKHLPAGTPCQIRSMCVFVACMDCEYPYSAGNYQ